MTDRARQAVWGAALAAALGAGGIAGQLLDRLTDPDQGLPGQVQLLRAEVADLRAELRSWRNEHREAFRDQRERDREQDRRIAARPLQRNPDLVTAEAMR